MARGDWPPVRDGLRAPGSIWGFPPPLTAWGHAARAAVAECWGGLVALGWSAALANPGRRWVVEPLAKLPADRLADRVTELQTVRAEAYRRAVREAVERAIAEVGQGTASGPRSRPR